MDMTEFYKQMLTNNLKSNHWQQFRDEVEFRRSEYIVSILNTDRARITWDGKEYHDLLYARAYVWVEGINRELDIRQEIEDRRKLKGQPPEGPLALVRDIGFNNTMGLDREPTEEIVFYGPHRSNEMAQHATEDACMEYIARQEHNIQTVKLYLANGKNRKTHEWTRTKSK